VKTTPIVIQGSARSAACSPGVTLRVTRASLYPALLGARLITEPPEGRPLGPASHRRPCRGQLPVVADLDEKTTLASARAFS